MSKDLRTDWLAQLKPESKVVINHYNRRSIRKIDRITPTGRIIVDGITYNHFGREIGTEYNARWLNEFTPEVEVEIINAQLKAKLAKKFNDLNFNALDLEMLIKLNELVYGKHLGLKQISNKLSDTGIDTKPM